LLYHKQVHMQRLLFLLLTLSISVISHAQVIKLIGKKRIQADGKDYALMEAMGCSAVDDKCQFLILNLLGERVCVIRSMNYIDQENKNRWFRRGPGAYLQFIFPTTGKRAETAYPSRRISMQTLAEIVVQAGFLKEGVADEAAIRQFVNANGTPFTQKAKEFNENN
jgi:hypothetical protein